MLITTHEKTHTLLQETKPVMTLHATGQAEGINDMAWCPGNSTVLAAVTDGGRLQIWDLATSSIDPVIDKLTEDSIDLADVIDYEDEDHVDKNENDLEHTFQHLSKAT